MSSPSLISKAVYGVGVFAGIFEQLLIARGGLPGSKLSWASHASRFTLGSNLAGAGENLYKGNLLTAALYLLGTRGYANFIPYNLVNLRRWLGATDSAGVWINRVIPRFFPELIPFVRAHEAFHHGLKLFGPLTNFLWRYSNLYRFLEELGANVFAGKFNSNPLGYVNEDGLILEGTGALIAYLAWKFFGQKTSTPVTTPETCRCGDS